MKAKQVLSVFGGAAQVVLLVGGVATLFLAINSAIDKYGPKFFN